MHDSCFSFSFLTVITHYSRTLKFKLYWLFHRKIIVSKYTLSLLLAARPHNMVSHSKCKMGWVVNGSWTGVSLTKLMKITINLFVKNSKPSFTVQFDLLSIGNFLENFQLKFYHPHIHNSKQGKNLWYAIWYGMRSWLYFHVEHYILSSFSLSWYSCVFLVYLWYERSQLYC